MLEGALESSAHEPGVKSVVAVLDEDSSLGEPEEGPSRISELRRADQHRTVDVVSLLGIRVDWRAAVDKRVEEGKGTCQLESFSAKLQDQEGCISCRLDVDGDKLRVVKTCLRADLGRIDGDLLPGH
jgi:hypothetical protein